LSAQRRHDAASQRIYNLEPDAPPPPASKAIVGSSWIKIVRGTTIVLVGGVTWIR
jgi:hypothetical protein